MTQKSKHENFIKVAGARVTKVIDTFRLLRNCANRANYEFTEQEVSHMFAEINKALKETKDAYDAALSKSTSKPFSFINH